MKKLFILMAAACCLTFTACNNNKPAEQTAEGTEPQTEACCPEMTEEQKAEMEACKKAAEDWQNWENLTEERKAELLDQRKAKYDEMQEMKKAQEEKKAAFEAAMNNWDKLTIDERKAKGDKQGCQKGEGHGCKKEGGCPNKK